MARQHAQPRPTWADVKAKLTSLDRLALINLIKDLYTTDKGNQMFLHARFGLSQDVLKPYLKKRWTAGCGRMYCGTRILPSQRRNRPSPVIGRLLVNPQASLS